MMGMAWKSLGVREETRDAVNELVEEADGIDSADEYIRSTLASPDAQGHLSDDTIEKLDEVEADG